MEPDNDKIDEAVLGLLWLTVHGRMLETARAWKSIDWDAMDRLCKAGLIDEPRNKNKSVVLTPEGLAAAQAAFEKLFAKPSPPGKAPKTPLPRK